MQSNSKKRDSRTVIELQRDGLLLVEDGNHGENRPRRDEFGTIGTSFIRAADMTGGRVLFESAQKISGTAMQRVRKGIGAGGDVVLSHKGTVGKVAYVPLDAQPFVCSPQTTFWRSLDNDKIDRRYLFSFLNSRNFKEQLYSRANETDMAGYVSLTSQRGLIVVLPPIEEQRSIAHILGSLDDKIELNHRMNATLEAMAQALFKSWFVDFDPVIDNALAAGNPIPEALAQRAEVRRQARGAVRDTAKHFPAAFQLTEELGWIPKGWDVRELGAITTELRRGISPRYTENNGVRVINQRCIRAHSVDYSNARLNDTTRRKVDGRHLHTGDVLVNSTGVGTLGRIAQVLSLDEPTVTDSHVTVVRSDPAHYMPYTFGRMMISTEQQVEAMGHGSTGQTELRRADLSTMPVIVPPLPLQEDAEALLSEWATTDPSITL